MNYTIVNRVENIVSNRAVVPNDFRSGFYSQQTRFLPKGKKTNCSWSHSNLVYISDLYMLVALMSRSIALKHCVMPDVRF